MAIINVINVLKEFRLSSFLKGKINDY